MLSLSQTPTQNLDALAFVVREISTRELRTNLVSFLTLSNSKPCVVGTPDFRKMLLSSSQSITQHFGALAVVVREISTRELRTNLVSFLTLSNSKPCVVGTPDFRKMLLSSSQSITQHFGALAVVVHEISNNEVRLNF